MWTTTYIPIPERDTLGVPHIRYDAYIHMYIHTFILTIVKYALVFKHRLSVSKTIGNQFELFQSILQPEITKEAISTAVLTVP